MRGDFDYINSDNTITNKTTGTVTKTEFSRSKQAYDLDVSKDIFPYLTFSGGAFYKLENSTLSTQGLETKTDKKTLRPVLRLDLKNPILKAGMHYNRTEQEEETSGLPSTQDFKDEYTAVLGYKPAQLPTLNLRYDQVHNYNDPETADSLEKRLSLDTRYTVWEGLSLDYDYSRNETENRIGRFETLTQAHLGRIGYSHSFLNRRLALDTSYRIRYDTFEFPGTATVAAPVLRDAGLSSFDNTPEDGPALIPNNALIDGDFASSAGLDIGLGGDETTLTNMAIDFGSAADVEKIYVWVDRRLSSSVINAFSWSVYTSPDNTDTSTWTLITSVSPAFFGTFQNRFEISFSSVSARFIKVVTAPLSPAVPDAADFPNIFITELEAFASLEGASVENENKTVEHNYSLNVRGKLGDQTTVGYNFYYLLEEEDPADTDSTEISNGFFFGHVFNDMFATRSSFSRVDREPMTDENSIEYKYAASLRANYLKTLRQTLTYSGTNEKQADTSKDVNSFVIHTNATLYRGWDLFLDGIYSLEKSLDGTRTRNSVIRSGTNLVPNDKLTIDGYYSFNKTKQDSAENGDSSRSEWKLNVFFIPFRTLSFHFGLDVVERKDSKTTLQNYTANWSPFRDGALQFFFAYNETLRPETDQKDRTVRPSLKWQLGKHAILDMSFSIVKSETRLETTDSNSFNADLKLFF